MCRGDRVANHVQEKGHPKGQRLPLRPWDYKDQPYESQSWNHNSTRSFYNRASSHSGYPAGPGEPYINRDNYVSNSRVRLHRTQLWSIIWLMLEGRCRPLLLKTSFKPCLMKQLEKFSRLQVCYHFNFWIKMVYVLK